MPALRTVARAAARARNGLMRLTICRNCLGGLQLWPIEALAGEWVVGQQGVPFCNIPWASLSTNPSHLCTCRYVTCPGLCPTLVRCRKAVGCGTGAVRVRYDAVRVRNDAVRNAKDGRYERDAGHSTKPKGLTSLYAIFRRERRRLRQSGKGFGGVGTLSEVRGRRRKYGNSIESEGDIAAKPRWIEIRDAAPRTSPRLTTGRDVHDKSINMPWTAPGQEVTTVST
ncbi:hypothetical protein FIBSPDRAFT_886312 [Athelia psychrophila]|uniref:Uncharacterized protein n=1 Tax=Athelia psychrophila TaxID=1759441 RepID=A0A166R0B6_9AGAM|nr:hypothetical protein FIBSPDRAFT_886312 [Fibularhizoctonia sp. CBS 109695]